VTQAPNGNANGNVERAEYVVLDLTGSGVIGAPSEGPWLSPSYPNPWTESTTLRFTLPAAASVEAAVYDVRGRLIARLSGGELKAGEHRLRWDGLDGSRRPAPSGVYFVRLTALGERVERKVVLLR
jgi:hypothetical protein